MGFNSVRFFNFRNIENSEVFLSDKNVFLVGNNGQGKTNFLESIYLLSVGSSFRTKNDSLLLKTGCKDMSLIACFDKNGKKSELKIKISKGKKEIEIDQNKIMNRKELIKNYPCIPFIHDDINFVSGSPSLRRLFVNQTISLFDLSFIDSLRSYNKIIRYRNILLKKKKNDLLEIYDEKAAENGLEIQQKREILTNNFNSIFSSMYKTISETDINLKIKYIPSWKDCNTVADIKEYLDKNKNRDFSFGTTTTGPHRDKILFYYENRDFSETASTGQIRLASIILRAAQALFITQKTGILPILLLDDVLLEIDYNKRKRFIQNLPEYEQAFFTFLPDQKLMDFENYNSYYGVKLGKIKKKVGINKKLEIK